MAMLIVEILGWMGAGLILLSYILLSLGRLQADSIAYQGLNIVGAAGFIVNSGVNGAIPSAVLNVIWLGIGLYAMSRIVAKRGAAKAETAQAESSEGRQPPLA